MESNLTKIRAFAFDVDGVMTDGGIFADPQGQLFRTFDAKDGFGVRMARMKGYPVGIITGGRSGSIRARFNGCGVPAEDIYLGSRVKIEDFMDFCRRHGLKPEEVIFFGDDVPDIEVMQAAGISICPGDAADDVKAIADIVSTRPGGRACVREYIERTLKLQGNWNFDQQVYKDMF